jgi:hypothetical protein
MKNKTLTQKWETLLGNKVDPNLFSTKTSYKEKVNLFKKHVKIINLETFSYCNRNCSYCPVSLLPNKKHTYLKESHFNLIVQNLKEINYSNTISLNLYNEPLSDDSIYNTIKELRDALPLATIFFNSNGDYLTNKVLSKLSLLGVNSIHITLHNLPKEIYSDTMSLKKIHKFYTKLDRNYTIDAKKENQYIRTSFKVNNLFVSVETTNYDDFGESRAGSIENLVDTTKKRDWPCARPYREFTLFSDGHAYPCCQIYAPLDEYKNSMGSLEECDSIFDLYSSKEMVELRHHLFDYGIKISPCANCSEAFLHEERKKLI